MSHYPERKEKDCLNCGAVVYGKFCHLCGQENIVPKETFWNLVTHFVYDVTHFDGKFFSTGKYLLTRPGFLPAEYIRGRRATYLNPIRMYVFTSAFFFIVFFSLFNPETNETEAKPTATEIKERLKKQHEELLSDLKDENNTPKKKQRLSQKLKENEADQATLQRDTTHLEQLNFERNKGTSVTIVDSSDSVSTEHYDSVQLQLKPAQRDGWLKQRLKHKKLEINKKYHGRSKDFLHDVLEKFVHRFPQILFISLPLFALLLRLLYIRRRNFYYADHLIYSIHLYCATFIIMFLIMTFGELSEMRYLGWLNHLIFPVVIYICWYNYKALRNFYRQSRVKTVLKLLLLLLLSSFVMSFLFMGFFLFSIFTL